MARPRKVKNTTQDVTVQPTPDIENEATEAVTENNQNVENTQRTSEATSQDKITMVQFRSMAVTHPDVNKLFQEHKTNLKNAKAVAEDMRRLGYHIDYETEN